MNKVTQSIYKKKVDDLEKSYSLSKLVDSNGNPRFIEGDLELQEIEGVTFTYNKWSLSGTHLMIVLAGNIVTGTVIASQTFYAYVPLPTYIFNKITPLVGNLVDFRAISYLSSNPITTQSANADLVKGNKIGIRSTTLTLTANRTFRIQFDLLIDSE